jgi:ATP-dependent RNA helicase DDX47/RRP3
LLQTGSRLFAFFLTPTRELALQIIEVVQALGALIGLSSLCFIGGIEMVDQAIAWRSDLTLLSRLLVDC